MFDHLPEVLAAGGVDYSLLRLGSATSASESMHTKATSLLIGQEWSLKEAIYHLVIWIREQSEPAVEQIDRGARCDRNTPSNSKILNKLFIESGLTTAMPKPPKRPVKIAERTMELIQTTMALDGASANELSDSLGLSKSTVNRYLRTLHSMGYLTYADGEYRPSLFFLELGEYSVGKVGVFPHARKKVDDLAEKTGESVWFNVLEHGLVVRLYKQRGYQAIQRGKGRGEIDYPHLSSSGKAMLACLPHGEVEKIISKHGLRRETSNTITDPDELFENLEQIRQRGYAYNVQETVSGLHGIGAAIKDEDGRPIGAINIAGPANRLIGERFERELPDLLLGAVNEIELNYVRRL